jgi:hypothetical protein
LLRELPPDVSTRTGTLKRHSCNTRADQRPVSRLIANTTPSRRAERAAATAGKSVDVQLIDIIRFGDDGLAHEHWGVFDALAMMQQLGAIPEDPSA